MYWCSNLKCDKKNPSKRKKCECGYEATKGFVTSYSLKPNKKQITKQTLALLKSMKIKSKKYAAQALNLNKKDFVIRIKQREKHFYLYFTLKSIGKDKLENLKLLGKPIIIIKFKGELDSNMTGIEAIEGIDFINWMLHNNTSELGKLIENALSKSQDLINESFRLATTALDKSTVPTPSDFENAIFSTLNYLFPHNQQLGGSNLADGAFAFENKNGTEFGLWDAKRYTKTKLSEYMQEKDAPRKGFPKDVAKDIKYISQFESNFKVKKQGGLKYYVFFTYDTDPADFIEAKIILENQLIKQNLIASIDSIGFCGNGEPTIHSEFTQAAKFLLNYRNSLSQKFGKRLLIGSFSNSSKIQEFGKILSKMDILVFKLDAGNQKTFSRINKSKEKFSKIVNSLRHFPTPYILSTAIVGEKPTNVPSLQNDFCDIVNSFSNARSIQLHNINLPVPIPTILHQPIKSLIRVGKKIANRVTIPVEILADNEYIE